MRRRASRSFSCHVTPSAARQRAVGWHSHGVAWRCLLAGWAFLAASCAFLQSSSRVTSYSPTDSRRDCLLPLVGASHALSKQPLRMQPDVAFAIHGERSLRSHRQPRSTGSHDSRYSPAGAPDDENHRRHSAVDCLLVRSRLPAASGVIARNHRCDRSPIRLDRRFERADHHFVRCDRSFAKCNSPFGRPRCSFYRLPSLVVVD